jgi:hypothetical protein
MSELTDRLRDGVDPPEDSEVADLIDFLEPELERFKRLLDDEHAKHMAALLQLHAIDHVHVVTTRSNWNVTSEVCLFDDELWPCWHHRQIHPDDPVVQDYVEKVRQQMDEIS